MKKLAMIRCLDVSMRCAGAGCMKNFNHRTGAFQRYEEEPAELISLMTCNGCGHRLTQDEGLRKKLDRLAEEPVDAVHLSSCTRKKDKNNPDMKQECPVITEMANYLIAKGVEVVRGTHH